MRRAHTRLATVAATALLAMTAATRAAGASSISAFTETSSGSIAFPVTDVHAPALAGSQPYGFRLIVQTGTTGGSIMLTAPAIFGTGGNRIPADAFTASCVSTSDPGAIFTTLGTVQLASTPVSCATLSRNAFDTVKFEVTLYLAKMDDAEGAFSADTYSSGSLTVVANAP